MEAVIRVNRVFLETGDWRRVAAALALLVLRGKSVSVLSEAAKNRLQGFAAPSREAFVSSLVAYLAALVMVSPLNLVLNEVLRQLRAVWSARLTLALARRMLERSSGGVEVSKDFESLVANDADKFVELQVDLAREVMEAASHLVFFTRILFQQSPFLAQCAVGTAVVTTGLSLQFGAQRLSELFQLERESDAVFSHTLSTVRENLEGIQFANAGEFELERIAQLDLARQRAGMTRKREKDVVSLACNLLRQLASAGLPAWILRVDAEESHSHGHGHLHPNPTHAGHSHASPIPPQKQQESRVANQLAVLVQTTEAFDEMLFHLLIVTENFHSVVRVLAIAQDLSQLLLDRSRAAKVATTYTTAESSNWLEVSQLSIHAPTSDQPTKCLVRDLAFQVPQGHSVLITGPSGCGKTSILRVLFGLWDAGDGDTKVAKPERWMCVAQKPYLCLGATLKEQVCFPSSAIQFTDSQVEQALDRVGLGQFSQDLHNPLKRNWQLELSVGEQQRVSFACILLNQHRYVLLDESTSSCDLQTEAKLYSLLRDLGVCFVSVGHRQSIEQYHQHRIQLLGDGNGAWQRVT